MKMEKVLDIIYDLQQEIESELDDDYKSEYKEELTENDYNIMLEFLERFIDKVELSLKEEIDLRELKRKNGGI